MSDRDKRPGLNIMNKSMSGWSTSCSATSRQVNWERRLKWKTFGSQDISSFGKMEDISSPVFIDPVTMQVLLICLTHSHHFLQPGYWTPTAVASSFGWRQHAYGTQTAIASVAAFSNAHSAPCSQAQFSLIAQERTMHDARLCWCRCIVIVLLQRDEKRIGPYLHLGILHCDSLQTLAWNWIKLHTFLHRRQPPEERILHCAPWWKSDFNFRQLG